MGALGDEIIISVVGFLVIAGLSLAPMGVPAALSFAKSCGNGQQFPAAARPNARFLRDRGFLLRKRVWLTRTCCPPVGIDLLAITTSRPRLRSCVVVGR